MKVFVTGASGFIGSRVLPELISHGHTVLGLARNEASAAKIKALGAEPHTGDLNDIPSLVAGVKATDATIHLGFIHDFSSMEAFANSNRVDMEVSKAMLEAMVGTGKVFINTSGLLVGAAKDDFNENDRSNTSPRAQTESLTLSYAQKGVIPISMRLSPVTHGPGDKGFASILIGSARKAGYAAYVDQGINVWPTAHVEDTAVLYRLALETAEKNKNDDGRVYHCFAELVPLKEIMSVIGEKLDLETKSIGKDEVGPYFGFLAMFAAASVIPQGQITQELTGWKATRIGLLEDLKTGTYFQ